MDNRSWQVMENLAGQGWARKGKSRQGKARQGRGRHGGVRAGQGVQVVGKQGMAGQAWQGKTS
jgi:hypothetical protein